MKNLSEILAEENVAFLPEEIIKTDVLRFLYPREPAASWIWNFSEDPLCYTRGYEKIGRLPGKTSREIKSSPLSIGFETLDRMTFEPLPVIKLLQDSGVKHARALTGWVRSEPSPGVYNFAWLDEVVDNLAAGGISTWLSLSFGNPFYTPSPVYDEQRSKVKDLMELPGHVRGYVSETPYYYGEAAMTGWKNFVSAVVKHFRGRVNEFEIWNEPEHFWLHKGVNMAKKLGIKQVTKDVTDFVRITSEVVRSANPEAVVIFDTASGSAPFIRELANHGIGKYIDVFAYHYYSHQALELSLPDRVKFYRATLGKDNPNLKLWQGESGRPSGRSAMTAYCNLYNQAKYMLRRYTADVACGSELSSFFTVSDFKRYYPDGTDQYYGIITLQCERKLAFYTLHGCGWLFEDLKPTDEGLIAFSAHGNRSFNSSAGYQVFKASFMRRGLPVFAVWRPENVDICADTVNGYLTYTCPTGAKFNEIVAIDPIRRNVYRLDKSICEIDNENGLLKIEPFAVADYPIFITDISIFDEFRR